VDFYDFSNFENVIEKFILTTKQGNISTRQMKEPLFFLFYCNF